MVAQKFQGSEVLKLRSSASCESKMVSLGLRRCLWGELDLTSKSKTGIARDHVKFLQRPRLGDQIDDPLPRVQARDPLLRVCTT